MATPTLYDGQDRQLSWQIFYLLRKFPWDLRLRSTPISIIEKKKATNEYLDIYFSELSICYYKITGRVLDFKEIKGMPLISRLSLVEEACRILHLITHPSSAH